MILQGASSFIFLNIFFIFFFLLPFTLYNYFEQNMDAQSADGTLFRFIHKKSSLIHNKSFH